MQAGTIFTVHVVRSAMLWDELAGLGWEAVGRAKPVAPGPKPTTTAMHPDLARADTVSTAARMRGNPATTKGGRGVASGKFDHLGAV